MSDFEITPCSPKVHIIIAGAEDLYSNSANKLMFLAQAVRIIKQESNKYDRALVIYFIADEAFKAYTSSQQNAFKEAVAQYKIKGNAIEVAGISTIDDASKKIKEYLESLKSEGCNSPGAIKRIDIFSHGDKQKIGFIYSSKNKSHHLTSSNVSKIKPEWFHDEAIVHSWACQTFNSDPGDHERPFSAEALEEIRGRSVAASISRTWNVSIKGYMRKTSYANTWSTGFSGYYDDWFGDRELIDGAVWEKSGADGDVVAAERPYEVPNNQFTLQPSQD